MRAPQQDANDGYVNVQRSCNGQSERGPKNVSFSGPGPHGEYRSKSDEQDVCTCSLDSDSDGSEQDSDSDRVGSKVWPPGADTGQAHNKVSGRGATRDGRASANYGANRGRYRTFPASDWPNTNQPPSNKATVVSAQGSYYQVSRMFRFWSRYLCRFLQDTEIRNPPVSFIAFRRTDGSRGQGGPSAPSHGTSNFERASFYPAVPVDQVQASVAGTYNKAPPPPPPPPVGSTLGYPNSQTGAGSRYSPSMGPTFSGDPRLRPPPPPGYWYRPVMTQATRAPSHIGPSAHSQYNGQSEAESRISRLEALVAQLTSKQRTAVSNLRRDIDYATHAVIDLQHEETRDRVTHQPTRQRSTDDSQDHQGSRASASYPATSTA